MLTIGCGGGGGGGDDTATRSSNLTTASSSEMLSNADCSTSTPLNSTLQQIWDETTQCTGLSGPEPGVVYSATVDCPSSHRHMCLADVPFFPCNDGSGQLCGAAGRYIPSCGGGVIELPDASTTAAAHEMIHHLLRVSGHPDWEIHSDRAFNCQ